MKKTIILLCASLIITSFYTYSMAGEELYQQFRLTRSYGKLKSNFDGLNEDIIQNYIKPYLTDAIATITSLDTYNIAQKKLYQKFGLTRSYGQFKLNLDGLNEDIIKKHIKPYLTDHIATKFKHKTLYRKNITLEPISDKIKSFHHHDGTYNIVPDIGHDYAMWDELHINKRMFSDKATKNNEEFFRILQQKNYGIEVYCSIQQYRERNKKKFNIIKNQHSGEFSSGFSIDHHVLSNDGTLLAFGFARDNNNVGILDTNLLQPVLATSLDGPIIALCAAYHSPTFAVFSKKGKTALVISDKVIRLKHPANYTPTCAQFSPNDKLLISYGGNTLALYPLSQKTLFNKPILITTQYPIKKALFSPDSQLLIIAMNNGQLNFYNSSTGKVLEQCSYRDISHPIKICTFPPNIMSHINNVIQEPLLLCSDKHKLLFSLDPVNHFDGVMYNFVVRKASGKFNFLIGYNFSPNIPSSMGLTQDERSVVFVDSDDDNKASLLQLYNDQDTQDIDFIEQTADLYQLCELVQICKNIKKQSDQSRGAKATAFVNAIRSYISLNVQKIG